MTPKTSIGPDTVMKVRIRGISSQMNRFRYLYGIILGELLLKHAHNLSWNLQHTSLLPRRSTSKSGVRGWGCVDAHWNPGRRTSRSIYSGQRWLAKWEVSTWVNLALPRRRKAPIRFDDICCAKETSRKQLRQRTNSRPTAAVGR